MNCRNKVCDGQLKPGKALHNSPGYGVQDPGYAEARPGFGTMSRTGSPDLVNVMKCEKCGYSRTMTDVEEFYAILRRIGFPLNDHAVETDKDRKNLWGIKAVWQFNGDDVPVTVLECNEGFRIEDKYYNGFEVLERLSEMYPWVKKKLANPAEEIKE